MASVTEALRERNYVEALDLLLEIWRATHDPQLVGVIDRVTQHIGGDTEDALAEATGEDGFHVAWMKIAKKSTPADLQPLLETLSHQTTSLAQLQERYDCIIERVLDDPRLSRGLLDIVEERFAQGNLGPAEELRIIERMIQKVATMRDERARQRLHDLSYSTHPWAPIAAAGAAAAQSLLRARPPTAVDARFFESVHQAFPIQKPSRKEELPPSDPVERRAWDLLQRIYEDPDDDEARLVYADALIEMNNPRGEAIAIGFKVAGGNARVTDRRRLDELIERHGAEWLGDARRVLDATRDVDFEKGFPAVLRTRWDARWKEVIDSPQLSTVRIVDTTGAYADFRDTLSSPTMRNVRGLRISTGERLSPHLPIFERIVHLEIHTSMLINEDLAEIRGAFPNVRSFGIWWSDDRAWDSRAMRPSTATTFVKLVSEGVSPLITSMTFRMHDRMTDFLTNAFDALPRVQKTIDEVQISAGPEGFVLSREPGGWRLSVEARDADFDPARVRLLMQALPETLPIVNRATIAIPGAVPKKKQRKK